MDLFLIILSGVCLIALAIYWIRLWREERDHKRAQALHRVANEKAAVRVLARATEVRAIVNEDAAYRSVSDDALAREMAKEVEVHDRACQSKKEEVNRALCNSDPITHLLALTFSWIATESSGDMWFYTHKPELTAGKTAWCRTRGTAVPMLSGEVTVFEDLDAPPWDDSLLHYNQITRTWEKA